MLNHSALSLSRYRAGSNSLKVNTSGVSYQSGITREQFQKSMKSHIIDEYIIKGDTRIPYPKQDVIYNI
jgi:hypothetical protein